jgi:PASTA domain
LGGPWWRRWYVVLTALLVLLAVVAVSDDNPTPTNDTGQTTPAPTTILSLPTVATTSTAPPTTIEKVTVPKLVGLRLAPAKDSLADRGLTAKVTYKSTGRYPAGTVISQSRKAGADVLPETTIGLVVAKAPPPSPAPPAPPPTAPSRDCHPSYPDVCLRPDASDYDCEGGSGNGPYYVSGPLRFRRLTNSSWTATTTMAGDASPDDTGIPVTVRLSLKHG